MIQARIIADSVNPYGSRLTSAILTYPRFIHSELMTYRAFSRNAASSRARPIKKVIEAIQNNPAIPEWWGSEQKGMQSGNEIHNKEAAKQVWKSSKEDSISSASALLRFSLHKSLVNRLLEPHDHITTLVTSTDRGLQNMFSQRANPHAQGEFQVLAYRLLKSYLESVPEKLNWGDWHLPRFEGAEKTKVHQYQVSEDDLKVAVARCARLSYLTFDGDHSREKDLELHDSLVANGHWSPFEHVAQAQEFHPLSNFDIGYAPSKDLGVNSGWFQYRKVFSTEMFLLEQSEMQTLLDNRPGWITV